MGHEVKGICQGDGNMSAQQQLGSGCFTGGDLSTAPAGILLIWRVFQRQRFLTEAIYIHLSVDTQMTSHMFLLFSDTMRKHKAH